MKAFVFVLMGCIPFKLKIIIAAGVTDQLPEIPGLAERWGKTVFTVHIVMDMN